MQRSKATFAGLAASSRAHLPTELRSKQREGNRENPATSRQGGCPLSSVVAGLLFIYGCGTESPAPSDLTGSGGLASTGGDAGTGGAAASGGAVGSGGAASGGVTGSGGLSSSGGAASGGGGSTFVLTSPAFENVEGCSVQTPSPCAIFPDENVSYMENANVSPELSWTGAPAGTQSFALVLFDVTFGQAHWALWNVPAEATMLAADVPDDTKLLVTPAGAEQANANFATTSDDGYFGPHLPCNVFELQLYALSLDTFSPTDPDSSVLVSIELQNLEEVLGIATLAARSGDYGTSCVAP